MSFAMWLIKVAAGCEMKCTQTGWMADDIQTAHHNYLCLFMNFMPFMQFYLILICLYVLKVLWEICRFCFVLLQQVMMFELHVIIKVVWYLCCGNFLKSLWVVHWFAFQPVLHVDFSAYICTMYIFLYFCPIRPIWCFGKYQITF